MSTKSYQFTSVFANEFNDYLNLRESQGHHVLKEKYYCRLLDQYLYTNDIIEKLLTASVIEGWIQSLPNKMSINTKIVIISHYSQFAKYLSSLGFSAFIPERPIGDKSYIPYVFSEHEIMRLFAAVDNIAVGSRSPIFGSCVFPLLLRILYGCGLRLGEALGLRIADVDVQSGVLYIRNAKGNKDRLVPMDNSLTEILRQYIITYRGGTPKESLVFPNRKESMYTSATVHGWFALTLEKAGIQQLQASKGSRGICPHCLRHTFAVNSFRKQDLAGIDMYTAMPYLSTYMGHQNILGTQTYLHMTETASADVIKQTSAYTEGLFPEVPQ